MISLFTSDKYPLAVPYGLKCLAAHLLFYAVFRFVLPSRKDGKDDYPWKQSSAETANKIVALFAMSHWTYLGFKHLWEHDYNAAQGADELAALTFVPAGFDVAQYAMGALLVWDIPTGLVGLSGPTDTLMHVHHVGMVLVTACVLGLVGPSSVSDDGIVGTHVAPIFLGAIELSSIPLQIVDLFHPKKSPHWQRYASDPSPTSSFQKLCSTVNELSRTLFAVLFLLVRGIYFPYAIAFIAAPDFYAEGSLPSMILLVGSVLFTILQLYWATLVFGQAKKAMFGGNQKSAKKNE